MRRRRKERDQRWVQLGRMQVRTFVVVRAFATEVVEADCIQVEVNTVPAFVVAFMRAFGFWVVPADLLSCTGASLFDVDIAVVVI